MSIAVSSWRTYLQNKAKYTDVSGCDTVTIWQLLQNGSDRNFISSSKGENYFCDSVTGSRQVLFYWTHLSRSTKLLILLSSGVALSILAAGVILRQRRRKYRAIKLIESRPNTSYSTATNGNICIECTVLCIMYRYDDLP